MKNSCRVSSMYDLARCGTYLFFWAQSTVKIKEAYDILHWTGLKRQVIILCVSHTGFLLIVYKKRFSLILVF